MHIIENFKNVVFNNFANFEGRASRSEYWYFVLVYTLVLLVFGILAAVLGVTAQSVGADAGMPVGAMVVLGLLIIFALAMFVPSLAVSVRRLHDTNRSGWWILLQLIPILNYIGIFVLLVFYCLSSTPGENQYGANPHGE